MTQRVKGKNGTFKNHSNLLLQKEKIAEFKSTGKAKGKVKSYTTESDVP